MRVIPLLVLLASCGGVPVEIEALPASEDAPREVSVTSGHGAQADTSPAFVPRRWRVAVGSDGFTPDTLRVRVGDTVEWFQAGRTTAIRSGFLCLVDGMFGGPLPVTYTFRAPGPYPYFADRSCAFVGIVMAE